MGLALFHIGWHLFSQTIQLKKKELAFQNYSTFKFQTYFSTGIHDGKKTFSPQVQAVRSHYWHIPHLQILLRAKPLQLCPALCDSMYCNLPGSSVHRILQARILEWAAMPFSRGSSRPRDQTQTLLSPALTGRFFATSAPWEAMIGG